MHCSKAEHRLFLCSNCFLFTACPQEQEMVQPSHTAYVVFFAIVPAPKRHLMGASTALFYAVQAE